MNLKKRDLSYTEETEYEIRHRKRRVNYPAVLLILVLIALIAALLFYTYRKKAMRFTSYKVSSTMPVTDGSRYIAYGNGYVRYTSEGAEAVSGNNVLWNVSYSMKKPVVDVCGDYCVFGDKGRQEICVTDGTGANNRIDVPDKIVDVCIASQGVTAVWTDSVDKDNILLYDIKGNLLLDIETDIASNGFPIAIDLSEDGTKLVTSYIKIGDEMNTWVTFYNFGDVGQNYSDRMVGSYSFQNKIIPKVCFINNERVAAFSENECRLYRMRETPEVLATQDAARLSAVCTNDTYVCLAENETDGTTKLTIFDTDGKKKNTIITGITYTGMCINDSELVVYNNSSCVMYNLDGSEKFRTQIEGGIKTLFPAGNNKYYIVGANEVKLITLKTDD